MIIISGGYQVAKRQVAYANCYCSNCDKPAIAEKWKYFVIGHFFFIPILPLGPRSQWVCRECGNHPYLRRRTGRGFKWAGFFAFGIMALLMFVLGIAPENWEGGKLDGKVILGVSALFLIGSILMWRAATRHDPIGTKAELLERSRASSLMRLWAT